MKALIKQFLTKGHQVILMADLNEDVRNATITTWAAEAGIREIVSKTTALTVPTNNKGSVPIDGIFMSHSLEPHKAGYEAFGII